MRKNEEISIGDLEYAFLIFLGRAYLDPCFILYLLDFCIFYVININYLVKNICNYGLNIY